jgi:hypothetical protein
MIFPLHHRGVLGLNARSLLYIKPFNPRRAVALADDKMKTKAFLSDSQALRTDSNPKAAASIRLLDVAR